MNTRTTFFLMLLVGGLGAYIFLYETKRDSTDDLEQKARKAFEVDPDEVTALSVEYNGFEGRFVVKDGAWYMEAPAGALADESAVKRLLNDLEKLERGVVISESDMKAKGQSTIDYGFTQPLARFSIRTGKDEVLYELGDVSAIGDEVYARVANSRDIISVPVAFLEALPKSMDDVRDRRLFLAKPESMVKIELKRPEGFVQLERRDQGVWWLTQPLQTRVDAEANAYLTGRFHTARIEKFVTDEKTDLAVYGFGDDSPYVRIWSELEEFPVKLILGGPVVDNAKLRYARMEGVDSVFAVSAGMDGLLRYELDAIRERRMVTLTLEELRTVRLDTGEQVLTMNRDDADTWRITQPQSWNAMPERIKTFFDQWRSSRVSRFVDLPDNPVDETSRGKKLYTVIFSKEDAIQIKPAVEEGGTERSTDYHYEVYEKEFGINKVLVHSVPDNSWCEVVPGMIKYINVDPLYYRDHEVLQIASNEVLRVSLTIGVATSSVTREAVAEGWTVEQDMQVLNDVRLDDTLSLCQHLVAASLVELNPTDLTRFGLDKPELSITFGLTGESGISRTLLLGDSLDDGTVYGMIRGKDLVFTLNDQARKILYNNFCQPKPENKESSFEEGIQEKEDAAPGER